jgi:GABA(A) receptor-associated protein
MFNSITNIMSKSNDSYLLNKNKNDSNYANKTTFESRSNESKRIRLKYPDRIPIIIERVNDANTPPIDKTKYLVPNNLTVGELVYVIRKRMKLEPEKAIFFFINETIPNTSLQLSQLYESHKNEDGFLYMKYSSENTFGSIN